MSLSFYLKQKDGIDTKIFNIFTDILESERSLKLFPHSSLSLSRMFTLFEVIVGFLKCENWNCPILSFNKLSQNYHFLSDFPILNHLFNIGIPKIDFLVFLLKTGESDECAGPWLCSFIIPLFGIVAIHQVSFLPHEGSISWDIL